MEVRWVDWLRRDAARRRALDSWDRPMYVLGALTSVVLLAGAGFYANELRGEWVTGTVIECAEHSHADTGDASSRWIDCRVSWEGDVGTVWDTVGVDSLKPAGSPIELVVKGTYASEVGYSRRGLLLGLPGIAGLLLTWWLGWPPPGVGRGGQHRSRPAG
jgi:hypothetical protein